MRRKRLRRNRQNIRHRLVDMEHNFFKAVHRSGMSLEDYLEKKWDKLSLKQQHAVLLGSTIGVATGAVVGSSAIGSLPLAGSMLALGYTSAKGIQFSAKELDNRYHHWKKAHKL